MKWSARCSVTGSAEAEVIEVVRGCEVSSSKIHVAIPVDLIPSGFGDGIDDQAAGLTIFCVVVVGENPEFLHLVDRCANAAQSAGVNLVGDISPIDVVKIAASVDGTGTNRLPA